MSTRLSSLLVWSQTRNAGIVFVSALIIVGLLIRIPALGLGFWRDEGSTYFDVVPNALVDVFHRIVYTELSPPGFFLVMYGWLHTIGASGVLFKIPALIFGTLLIPAVFVLAFSLGSRPIAYTATLIAVVSPEAIRFSQEARPQILAALLATLTVIAYFKMLASRELRPWVLVWFIASGAALLYVQYTGVVLMFLLMLVSGYLIIRGRAALAPHLIAFAAIFALFVPWFPVMLDHRAVGIPGAGQVHASYIPGYFLNNLVILFPVQGQFRVLTICVALLALVGFVAYLKTTSVDVDLKLIILIGVPAIIALLEAVVIAPVPRYLFIVAPFAWIVVAAALVYIFRWLVGLQKPIYRNLAVTCLAILVLLGGVVDVGYALSLGDEPKSGVPAALSFLHNKDLTPTFFIVTPDYLASTVGFYARNDPNVHLYGFAHWSHPEISTLRGEVELWSSPTILRETEARMRTMPRNGADTFALVAKEPMATNGRVHFERSNALVSDTIAHYKLVEYKWFPGRYEDVSLYVFR